MARTRRNRTTHKLGRSTWRQYGFAEFKGLMYLVLAAAYSSLSLFNLSPVYGSIPSSLYHTQAWTSVLLLAIATAVFARQRLPQSFASWLPVIAFWIPTIQSVLFNYSSRFGPVFGPLITEALTVLPLLLLSTFAAWDAFSGVAVRTPRAADTMRGIAAFAVMAVGKKSFASLVRSLTGFFPFVMSSGLQILLASLYTFLAPSRLLWLAIPSLLHSLLFNVHMPFPQTTSLLNQKLFSQSSYTVLARRESVTGYLSVLESQKDHLRVMRCDHSLLGGVWLMSQDTQQPPRKVEEPIYSVFALLEAVRLVEIDEPMRLHGRSISEDSSKEALMIGLGVGTPAAALIAHGVNTTIVEIDPVVHDYATIYFGLPLNHVSVIEDAVTFVERAGRKQSSYDFIIHDVFTGGAEPISLFTVEFIRGLRRLLKPNGVVAINYAGDLQLPPARLIVRTIRSVFPSCRIFREVEGPKDGEADRDFTNLVIFCINSGSGFSFRKPTEADLLQSPIRRECLFPKYEINPEMFEKQAGDEEILTQSSTPALEKWSRQGALWHWEILRTVLPDAAWVNW